MTFSVTQYGKPLSETKYKWDEETRTFSTKEDDLVLDFSDYSNVSFVTGYSCTFKTGPCCTFKTGNYCTFTTWSDCTFTTGSSCTFTTGSCCIFTTGHYCTFTTEYSCTFTTQDSCTFNVYHCCEFAVGKECSITRRDVFEVIIPDPDKKIKLREFEIKGFYTEEELMIKEIIE